MVYLTSAGSTSRGTTGWEGGEPLGDNTGKEFLVVVYDPNFYNSPQTCVLRCKNADIRIAIAIRHHQMAICDVFGYDQSQRLTAYNELMKVKGYEPFRVTVKCACDCSSSVNAVVITTFLTQGIKINISPSDRTATMRKNYLATGWFEDVTSSVDLKTGKGLIRGDILLKQSSHVVVVWDVDEDKTYDKTPKRVEKAVRYCNVYSSPSGETLLSAWPHLGEGNKVDICDESANRYYVRIAAVNFGWVDKGDLIPVVETRKGRITTDLNVRSGAGTKYSKIGLFKGGTVVQITTSAKTDDGVTWYFASYGALRGFVSSKYVKII